MMSALLDWLGRQLADRTLVDWLLFCWPVWALEMPRYFVPALALGAKQLLRAKSWWPATLRRIGREQAFLSRAPLVSVIVAGRNEEGVIGKCIESLWENDYPNKEIIVVDDCSDDRMYQRALPYARAGKCRLFRNGSEHGRSGRPFASNLAQSMARGEFVLSVDADTTFDRGMITAMVAPFADPRVGAVAGHLKVRGARTVAQKLQALEYLQSITLWKHWTSDIGCLLQASGAIGCFRRSALAGFGAWDPELAEDLDLSLKMIKRGYRIVFAPRAIALTEVPPRFAALRRQRIRWDRGGFRALLRKHQDVLVPGRYEARVWVEAAQEAFWSTFMPLSYLVYLVWMLAFHAALLPLVAVAAFLIYAPLSLITTLCAIAGSERREDEVRLLRWVPLLPFYKTWLRWVRYHAYLLEVTHRQVEDGYLPRKVWGAVKRNAFVPTVVAALGLGRLWVG